jgi:hypothetical protein
MDEDHANVSFGRRRIIPCRLTDEIVDSARRFDAGKTAASNDESQQRAAS